jgi:hypothetical protein
LDPWWLRCGWNENSFSQDDNVFSKVLNEHYKRFQRAYLEVVASTFGKLTTEMRFSTAVPLRWHLTVVRREPPLRGGTEYFKLLPAASWEQAGADVQFSVPGVGVRLQDTEDYFAEFHDALAKFGRSNSTFYGRMGFKPMPYFDGTQYSGYFDGATSVVHEVCSILKDELTSLFSAIPYDVGMS